MSVALREEKRVGREIPFEELTSKQQKLLEKALEVLDNAYNPHSGFFVGAAVLTRTGKIIDGTNVEDPAYGSSICAERSALLRANAEGYGESCIAIAVVTKDRDGKPTREVSAPCGACRQMISTAAWRSGEGPSFEVILATTKFDKVVVTNIGELFPMPFSPEDLSHGA